MSDPKKIPLTFALASSAPRKSCASFDELMEWLRNAEFQAVGLEGDGVHLGYFIGGAAPGVDYRHLPWIDTSKDPVTLRVYRGGRWVPVTNHLSGELQTRARLQDRIADDIPEGWGLADGSVPGVPNLTSQPGFFLGESPNWTVYTVAFVGFGGSQ